MRRSDIPYLLLAALMVAFLASPDSFAWALRPFVRPGAEVIYHQTPLWRLTVDHVAIVLLSTALAGALAIGLAILTTRASGREFLPLSRALANIGQTFPPTAVLALAVPIFGFGYKPTLIALFLYGLLPVFETTLLGFANLPPKVLDAARGMGMVPRQILWRVELPLVIPAILAGLRLSAIIAIATATIGSTVAASTLGEVIMSGISVGNTAFVLQGAFVVGVLAILTNAAMLRLEEFARRRIGASRG